MSLRFISIKTLNTPIPPPPHTHTQQQQQQQQRNNNIKDTKKKYLKKNPGNLLEKTHKKQFRN